MKHFLLFLCLHLFQWAVAQNTFHYQSLDADDPIRSNGQSIVYRSDTFALGPNAFFIDGQLSDAQVAAHPYVFNSLQSAVEKLRDGTETQPMTLYLAPWVYWADDPDDPAVRYPEAGERAPYGMKIRCAWLRFYGLNQNPANVVLACNRGQTIGAQGNFTLFRFFGDGTSSENITFGNYCNIDLEYPLKPSLGRKKRADAIVQAQLIHCDGDKIVARNTRFVSRLNLCPFVGGKRVLFDRCHFESTDDALCGTGVYLNSTFDFYSSKPFYITRGTGAVLLNCAIKAYTRGEQYFVKAGGQLAVIDTRFQAGDGQLYVGWKDLPPVATRNYQSGNSLNAKPLFIGERDAACTVEMTGKLILDAYRVVTSEGKQLYNTYNLLKGQDDWDPMDMKNQVLRAEKEQNKRYTDLPTQLLLHADKDTLETGRDTAMLSLKLLRFGNFEVIPENIQWRLTPASERFARLAISPDGLQCRLIPMNSGRTMQDITVIASTLSGLEAACLLHINPEILPAPGFQAPPRIVRQVGELKLEYQLATDFEDQSAITWYRCSNQKGENAIPITVSRLGKSQKSYSLTPGDAGHYIKAVIAPRHIQSAPGAATEVMFKGLVRSGIVGNADRLLHADFSNFSLSNQPLVMPGFWTWRHLNNPDVPTPAGDAWYYGEGQDGAQGMSGLLQGRSGFMGYTPVGQTQGDMDLWLSCAPFKSAGQGFSVAPLYMDVLIKFDAATMTGYGLRIERTTKYSNAVDFVFVYYQNGTVTRISEPVSTSCYRTLCNIHLQMKADRLIASARTDMGYNAGAYPPAVLPYIEIEVAAEENSSDGFGILYNGGAPTLIQAMDVAWK